MIISEAYSAHTPNGKRQPLLPSPRKACHGVSALADGVSIVMGCPPWVGGVSIVMGCPPRVGGVSHDP